MRDSNWFINFGRMVKNGCMLCMMFMKLKLLV